MIFLLHNTWAKATEGQGHDENDNFTQLLQLLGTNNKNIVGQLYGRIGYKYTHNKVQNEILDILTTLTLQEKLKTILECKFFFHYCQ